MLAQSMRTAYLQPDEDRLRIKVQKRGWGRGGKKFKIQVRRTKLKLTTNQTNHKKKNPKSKG